MVRRVRGAGTRDFCTVLAALVGPVQNMFCLAVYYFNSFVPIAQQAGQAAVLAVGRLSISRCLWIQHSSPPILSALSCRPLLSPSSPPPPPFPVAPSCHPFHPPPRRPFLSPHLVTLFTPSSPPFPVSPSCHSLHPPLAALSCRSLLSPSLPPLAALSCRPSCDPLRPP